MNQDHHLIRVLFHFLSKELFEHELSHETCGLEGCTYTANPKQVEIHILHLHSTGLYQKRLQSQKENDNSTPVATKTCGESTEEIKKWREERKKNFPSVVKTEQAVRQRKLRYLRKLKVAETRHQKDVEMQRARQKRREEIIEARKSRQDPKREDSGQSRNQGNRKRKRTRQKPLQSEGKEMSKDLQLEKSIDNRDVDSSKGKIHLIVIMNYCVKNVSRETNLPVLVQRLLR